MDRNTCKFDTTVKVTKSLSARRAWIEMEYTLYCPPFGEVALRKESVDRNQKLMAALLQNTDVALRKESVDRNAQHLV